MPAFRNAWWLAVVLLATCAGVVRGQEAGPAVGLPPDTARVLYIPLPDDTSPRLKRQELSLITRFFRTAGLAQDISAVSTGDPSLFAAVEAGLVMDARAVRCGQGEEDDVLGRIDDARKLVGQGNYEKAKETLERAREGLPCATQKLGRRQLAELFLFNGLVAMEAGLRGEGEVWIRSAVSVDEELKTSSVIPEKYVGDIERLAFEAESGEKVDARLSPNQGDLWLPRNLVIDGRRLIFDRMFLELVPGYHYIQVALPDSTSWGALLFVEPGQIYDLIEGVRESLHLREHFDTQVSRAVDEGNLEPALAQGLLYYAKSIQRDEVYLARLRQAEGNTAVLTLRRFQIQHGLHVPEEVGRHARKDDPAQVEVQFVPPWGVDAALAVSPMRSPTLPYRSIGLGVELDGRYLITQQLYVGASLGGGARFSAKVDGQEVSNLSTWPDLSTAAYVGLELPVGNASVRADLGYLQLLYPLRELPFECVLSNTLPSGELLYACSDDPADLVGSTPEDQARIPFSFSGIGAGPRVRVGLVFAPVDTDAVQIQGLLRFSYTPLFLRLPEEGPAVVDGVAVSYELQSDAYAQLFHRLGLTFGITGTF